MRVVILAHSPLGADQAHSLAILREDFDEQADKLGGPERGHFVTRCMVAGSRSTSWFSANRLAAAAPLQQWGAGTALLGVLGQ